MDGLVFVGSKDNIMLRVVGPGDLVLPLYYYRWGNGRSFELPELTQLVIGKAGTRVDSQSAETSGLVSYTCKRGKAFILGNH